MKKIIHRTIITQSPNHSITNRGSLLVITLWLIAVLSLMAIGLAGYLSAEAHLSAYQLARAQAKSWTKTGVYLAMERLAEDAKQADEACDWLGDDWAGEWKVEIPMDETGPSPGSRVTVEVTDEERRLDLNSAAASAAVLTSLLHVSEAAEAVVEYRGQNNRPMRVMEELFDLPAIRTHQEVAPTLRAYTTVYTQGRINMNTASMELLRAMKGDTVSTGLIQSFVVRRGVGADGRIGTADDCLLAGDAESVQRLADCMGTSPAEIGNVVAGFGHQSAVFRIVADGVVLARGVRHHIEAVVLREGTRLPFRVLAWRES